MKFMNFTRAGAFPSPDNVTEKPFWFYDTVDAVEQLARVGKAVQINKYLLREHKILQRRDFIYKKEPFITAKVLLNTLEAFIRSHAAYCVGQPVSISGNKDIVSAFNLIYKKGGYNKTDYQITTDLYKHGNAFEYPWVEDGVIRSHVIPNEEAFPVYNADGEYTHFVEHWRDINGRRFANVYHPNRVQKYRDRTLLDDKINLSGLPIHYAALTKSAYPHFGEGIMHNLIPIMDRIESLMSKMDDTTTTLLLNPIPVIDGARIEGSIPKDICGAGVSFPDGGSLKYPEIRLEHKTIKLLLDQYLESLYANAGLPSVVMGQSNVSNLSEVSLKMLFAQTDNMARETAIAMREGMLKRFGYINKLLNVQGKAFPDEAFDTLDVNFNFSRPVDTKSLMEELEIQRKMGCISKRTVIDKSPHTVDTSLEVSRIEEETGALPGNSNDQILS